MHSKMQKTNLIIIFFYIIFGGIRNGFALFQSPSAFEWIPPYACAKMGQIYNTISMGCTECPNQNETPRSTNECDCAPEYMKKMDMKLWNGQIQMQSKCLKCPERHAVSFDGKSCVRCVNSEGNFVEVDKSGGCPSCGQNEIIQQGIQTKTNRSIPLNTRLERCVACPEGTIPDAEKLRCIDCNTLECACKLQKNLCDVWPSDSSIEINSLDQKFQSAYLRDHISLGEAQCRAGNQRECQHLANMCVIQDLSRDIQGGACSLLESLRQSTQTTQEFLVPLLYYQNFEAAVEIFRENAIEATFSLLKERPNPQLDLFLFVYTLNGTFLGEFGVKTETLQLCKTANKRNGFNTPRGFRFGVYYYNYCVIELDEIKQWTRNLAFLTTGELESTLFFEPFIRYMGDDGRIMAHPIPILNENVFDRSHPLNRINTLQRDSRVLLTRRFFMVDSQQVVDSEKWKFVRFAQKISLNIHLQRSREERIYVPYLRIKYTGIMVDMESNRTQSEGEQFGFEFSVEYIADSFHYDKTIEVAMATLCSASAMWAAIQAYSWGRRAGKLVVDGSTVIKFVIFAAENIGNVFFLVIGIVSCWKIYAYKFQKYAVYFPLTFNQEWSFIAYLISAISLKAVSALHCYIYLALVEVFFIDWERPRVCVESDAEKIQQQQRSKEPTSTDLNFSLTSSSQFPNSSIKMALERSNRKPPVIWRTYLIANKWNELQSHRKINLSLQLLAVLFVLEWLGFGRWAKLEPGFEREENEVVPESRMSHFAVDFSFYFLLVAAQWLFRVLILEKVADHFRNFMDLCSMANISVLVMTHPLRGFYIHGRSVHGTADTDMAEINRFLERERENLCALRGLESSSEVQTFTVNMPLGFRERLNQILGSLKTRSTHTFPPHRQHNTTATKVDIMAKIHGEVNDFLKDVINHVNPSCDYTVRDSRLIEDILEVDLADTLRVGNFVRDNSEVAYSAALLYGNEWTMSTFEGLLFCTISLWTQNRILAAFATYIGSLIVKKAAMLYFTSNLARTSLIDNRFIN